MKAFINGNIYTPDTNVQALAVKNGRIEKVGSNKDILLLNPTETIDLKGKTVLPGFIDSHLHLLNIGKHQEALNLKDKSFSEILDILKNIKTDSWIIGINYDDNKWDKSEYSFDMLNKATPNNPVFLSRVDCHAAIVNKVACKNTKTGILIDSEMDEVIAKLPKSSKEDKIRYLKNAEKILFKNGITTVCDMCRSVEDVLIIKENTKINYFGFIEELHSCHTEVASDT